MTLWALPLWISCHEVGQGREVALHRLTAREQGRHRGRVLHRHRHVVELVEAFLPPLLRRRHLQHPGLDRHLHRGRRDLVVLGVQVVRERLHARVVGVELERHRGEVGHRAHVQPAHGLVPDGEQRADAAGREVDVPGQQRLVDRGAAAEAMHGDRDIPEPRVLRARLDELLVDDDVHGQVEQTELLGESDLVRFRRDVDARAGEHGSGDRAGDISHFHGVSPVGSAPGTGGWSPDTDGDGGRITHRRAAPDRAPKTQATAMATTPAKTQTIRKTNTL